MLPFSSCCFDKALIPIQHFKQKDKKMCARHFETLVDPEHLHSPARAQANTVADYLKLPSSSFFLHDDACT